MDKVDRRQEQMCKASREMEILRKNQKKKKNTSIELKKKNLCKRNKGCP